MRHLLSNFFFKGSLKWAPFLYPEGHQTTRIGRCRNLDRVQNYFILGFWYFKKMTRHLLKESRHFIITFLPNFLQLGNCAENSTNPGLFFPLLRNPRSKMSFGNTLSVGLSRKSYFEFHWPIAVLSLVIWSGQCIVDCPTRWSLWYWYLDFYVDHLVRYPNAREI